MALLRDGGLTPTSMCNWLPLVEPLGLPVPRTALVALDPPVDPETLGWRCITAGHEDHEADLNSGLCRTGLDLLIPRVQDAIEEGQFRFPLFIRTDLFSGKHQFNETCYVEDPSVLGSRLWNLLEMQAMALMFTPGNLVGAIAVRNYVPLAAHGTAWGGLPIAPEFRYFVRGGTILCRHPYWQDVENLVSGMLQTGHTRDSALSVHFRVTQPPSMEEEARLREMAHQIGMALSGVHSMWSVDFAKRRDPSGPQDAWMFIDAAEAESSWHPEDCPSEW